MIPEQMVIFDLDDTLLDTSHIYYQCRNEFVELLSGDVNRNKLVDRFEEMDSQNIDQFSYASWRYAYTMSEVYNSLVADGLIPFRPAEAKQVISIGSQIRDIVPDLRQGAVKTLRELSEGHTLTLLTRGHEKVQRMKIQHHNLNEYFLDVHIVTEKKPDNFKSLAGKHGFSTRRTWSVGDSPKWDIDLALEVGMNAILVDYSHEEYEWKHEKRHHPLNGKAYKVESLLEVPDLIYSAAEG
jgi:putative hydrolase of the HAD superfamily